MSNGGGICSGKLGFSEGIEAVGSGRGVGGRRAGLGVVFYCCPCPGIICGVKYKVVLGAASISLYAFFLEGWTISVIAWVRARAVSAFEVILLRCAGICFMHSCTLAASGGL